MIMHKNAYGFWCALTLAVVMVAGCSRQQSDWQKARETNTTDAYEQYLKKYPSGEFTAQAQARVKELYEERDWQKARDADTPEAYQAFLKQYPEGKWTEEARIRVENFTLAQAPATPPGGATPGAATEATGAGAPSGETPAQGSPTAPASKSSPPHGSVAPTVPASKRASSPASTAPAAARSTASAPAGNTAKSAGAYGIQLGAFKSGTKAAHERWVHLQKQYPTQLRGLASKVVTRKTASGTLYRLRATGLTEKRADAICRSLRAKSQACVVVRPGTSPE